MQFDFLQEPGVLNVGFIKGKQGMGQQQGKVLPPAGEEVVPPATAYPKPSNLSAKWLPTNPETPVTRHPGRMFFISLKVAFLDVSFRLITCHDSG